MGIPKARVLAAGRDGPAPKEKNTLGLMPGSEFTLKLTTPNEGDKDCLQPETLADGCSSIKELSLLFSVKEDS